MRRSASGSSVARLTSMADTRFNPLSTCCRTEIGAIATSDLFRYRALGGTP